MKIEQLGRSMIEMLGVLAIIGVLSVGGIAGYSKAMMKHNINKTIDHIAQIATNTRTFLSEQKNYEAVGSDFLWKIAAPKELRISTNRTGNVFGGTTWMRYSRKSKNDDKKAFILYTTNIPEEACLELATVDWGKGANSGLIAFGVNSDVSGVFVGSNGSAKIATPYSTNYPIPMKPSSAVVACQAGTNNTLYWKFY